MSHSDQLPRATRRRGSVLLQLPGGLLWIRRNETLTYAAGEGTGGWLLCGGQPRVAVAGADEASAAMSAVWQAFERSFFRSAVAAGVTVGWLSALMLVAALVLFMPRQRAVPAAQAQLSTLAPPPPASGGAIDHLD